jgi:hypothetical protein
VASLGPDGSFNEEGRGTVPLRFRAVEGGGVLIYASWPDGTIWKAPLGALRGRARLHASDSAAVGAVLSLAATNYMAVTDSMGRFVIGDLLPGPYSLQVIDPTLNDLGITAPRLMSFVAGAYSIITDTLNVPTLDDYIIGRCGKHRIAPGAVMLLGRILGMDGQPAEDAEVLFAHPETEPFSKLRTVSDGIFYLCLDASHDHDRIVVRVRHRGASELREVTIVAGRPTILHVSMHSPRE